MAFLIAYDIANPRRLQRVARFLERRALRCQKSVFVMRADRDSVERLLDELALLLVLPEDCVQAWELTAGQSLRGLVRGRAVPLEPAGVVAGPGLLHVVEVDSDERHQRPVRSS